jgi:hypothetical protein
MPEAPFDIIIVGAGPEGTATVVFETCCRARGVGRVDERGVMRVTGRNADSVGRDYSPTKTR